MTSNRQTLSDLGPLYHDFAIFGVTNEQLPGIYAPNQAAKAPILRGYIQAAIAKCRYSTSDEVTFAEMFCADAYYALVALHLGATRSIGIDNGFHADVSLPGKIAERLGLAERFRFLNADLTKPLACEHVDVVANVGGLYHVGNPADVLRESYRLARRYLIVQSVYSLAETSRTYLEAPAPGWTWGCRFSLGWLDDQVRDLGGRVLDQHTNLLEGNTELKDRGSAYYLIAK